MSLLQIAGLRSTLVRTPWRRGLRAGVAVGSTMFVCLLLHHSMGWAALGALYVCLVDNDGPHRSRLGNMLTVLVPGALAVMIGSVANVNLVIGLTITLAFCFLLTLARVISQPMAASSVLILICYIVAFGSTDHLLLHGAADALDYLLGGLWAAALAAVLWPLDPFRPARNATAEVYASLLQLSNALSGTYTVEGLTHFNDLLAQTRLRIEQAQAAIIETPARMAARTIRARNLTVLTKSADLLLARILRFAEFAETSLLEPATLQPIEAWLQASLAPLELALRQRPLNNGAAFAREGSLAIDLHRSASFLETNLLTDESIPHFVRDYIVATLRDALFNIEIAYEALRSIWTGAESRQREFLQFSSSLSGAPAAMATPLAWVETLRSNFTIRSVMFRHALRVAVVVAVDGLLVRTIHVTHGYWLAMTSLIVLRPFAGETVRRSIERVAGTIAGGILAAGFTAVLTSESELIVLVMICAAGSVALYTVEYAWYCFFVTPAIVLLTLPQLHDWHLAVIRTEMTLLGALVAVFAMLLLWPERESLQLPGLLARGAAADAAYLRATLLFWQQSTGQSREVRIDAERALLAPARRLCGLAVNDAEDTLDHALLEHSIPLNPRRSSTELLNSAALTFTTYLRRLTRTTTTLAAIGPHAESLDPGAAASEMVTALALRLDGVVQSLSGQISVPLAEQTTTIPLGLAASLHTDQLRRMERQISILERTALDLAAATQT
jgi:uncharacterized membrane protein YccC